ncbi:MAG: hypothetical protein ACK4P1_03760 [Aggregatilineales bacterium]
MNGNTTIRSVQMGIVSFGIVLALSAVLRAALGAQPALEAGLLLVLGVPAYALGYTAHQIRGARRARRGQAPSDLALALGDLSFVITLVGLIVFGAANGLSRRVEDGTLGALALVYLALMALVLGLGWLSGRAVQRLTQSVAAARALPDQPTVLPRLVRRAFEALFRALETLWRLLRRAAAYSFVFVLAAPFFLLQALISGMRTANRWVTQVRERVS